VSIPAAGAAGVVIAAVTFFAMAAVVRAAVTAYRLAADKGPGRRRPPPAWAGPVSPGVACGYRRRGRPRCGGAAGPRRHPAGSSKQGTGHPAVAGPLGGAS
jgi:hypothetical protein